MSKDKSTLCWDCANATNNDCPWVDRGEPVDGWWARHRRISSGWRPYETFCVMRCPMFERDASRGGQTPYKPLKGENGYESGDVNKRGSSAPVGGVAEPVGSVNLDNRDCSVAGKTGRGQGLLSQPNRDTFDLAYYIIERAVEDWKALDYGRRSEVYIDKEIAERREVLEFFFSRWFAVLCDAALDYTPQQIRRALRIPEDALEVLACAEGRR